MRDADGIDIVTCLYDLTDLPHLDQLVFSVMAQTTAAPLRLHLMLQRFSFTAVQAVRESTAALRGLNERVSMTLHNWDFPAPFDLRIPLLNWGLEVALGRYVTCIGIHDILCPQACAALLARLLETQAALALGGAAVQPVWWWGDVVVPAPTQTSSSAPPPMFIVDRSRLAARDYLFGSCEPGAETQAFIDRLGTRYPVDTACLSSVLTVRKHAL